jgi:hypothetical protein
MSHALFSPEQGDREEMMAVLHEEIDRLPERCRVLVVLCDLQGLSHEKAARHLGWPVGTVKSQLARARELLRGRLSRPGKPTASPVANGLGLALPLPSAEVVLPGNLVDSTVRAAAPFAAGKALAVGLISARVAILIEEVLKTMLLTRLKLASAFILIIGGIAAGTAGVLAQSGAGSGSNQNQIPAAGASAQTKRVEFPPRAPAPAYITRSRAMIITRLEEEAAEAKARLDRILRQVPSPDDPAAVRARKTVEALGEFLARVDVLLVDAVERYPTMFDFSSAPSLTTTPAEQVVGEVKRVDSTSRRVEIAIGSDDSNHQPGASSAQTDLERAWDRVEWTRRMFEKGYVSRAQLATELQNYSYEAIKARSEGQSQTQAKAPQPGQNNQPSGAGSQKSNQQGEGQNNQNASQQAGPKDQQPGNAQKNQAKNPAAQAGQSQNDTQQARQNQPQGQPGEGRQAPDRGPDGNQIRGKTPQPPKP